MAIKQLKASPVSASPMLAHLRILAGDQDASEVTKQLKKIGETVDDLINLQSVIHKQLTQAALVLEVDLDAPKNSPKLKNLKPETVGVESLTKLRKNYAVLHDLYSSLLVIEALEAKIRTGVRKSTGISTDKTLTEIQRLKTKVKAGIQASLDLLTNLSRSKHPKSLEKFASIVQEALSKSLDYREIGMRSYVFEVDGVLCYTDYIRMMSLLDDKGRTHPEVILALTYKTGTKPEVYVGVFKKFQPPSPEILMKKVETVQGTLNALSILLDLDGIENALNKIPVGLLLKKGGEITKDLFSFENYISSIVVDDHSIVFNLKASVVDRALVDRISTKIYHELKSVVRKSNARLRMATKKVGKSYGLEFFFVTANDAPLLELSDVAFMKDRFGLSDDTLSKVVELMNVGV